MSEAKASNSSGGRCPTCRKPTDQAHRPFCSKRCADIDLARWLGGTFVIPGPALDVADDSGERLGEPGARGVRTAGDEDD